MTTLLHLTGDDGRHVGHAVRSTALLAGHDELGHESVVLLAHRDAPGVVLPDSSHTAEVVDLLESGVSVRVEAARLDALGPPTRRWRAWRWWRTA
jgi:hypothetical protein